ncbi:hypothetical protein [Nocardioides sp. GCM10030258]|uniref:hypothetical protein n=1 Tax=unclassified Nocardioides TaxID=2615069 RepID=UPI00361517B8
MGTFVSVMRVIAGALPSALLVVAVFLISTLALALGEERRKYALEVVDRMLKLAAVLVGLGPTQRDEQLQRNRGD